MPTKTESNINYRRVARALEFLVEHHENQPTLKELSEYVGVSEFHLQRVFTEWAGVSPKQFVQYLTKENAKRKLRENSVSDTALSCGLSGSSRLYDLFVTCESVTPGEYRTSGAGMDISYGVHDSPFGLCLIATTPRGICKMSFFDSDSERAGTVAELESEWPNALITEDQNSTAIVYDNIFEPTSEYDTRLNVVLKGTPFQLKVWEALLRISSGQMCSYQQMANAIGRTSSVRAVATAVARNKVAFLIPCHRVIRSTGVLSKYRWGDSRKAAILGWEESRQGTALNNP